MLRFPTGGFSSSVQEKPISFTAFKLEHVKQLITL